MINDWLQNGFQYYAYYLEFKRLGKITTHFKMDGSSVKMIIGSGIGKTPFGLCYIPQNNSSYFNEFLSIYCITH